MSGYFYTMPANVFYDKNLSANAKLIACVIANFCDKYGNCTVTNKNLGNVLGKSERSLSRFISELQDEGYIRVQVDAFDTFKRTIYLTEKMVVLPTPKLSTPHDKTVYPPRQICLHNNTKVNNTKNNIVEEVLNHLNKVANSDFRKSNQTTVGFINGRVAEGYNLEDFIKVIDDRYQAWKGTEYEQYLRPSTLFRPDNFEKYINFAKRAKEQKPKIKA